LRLFISLSLILLSSIVAHSQQCNFILSGHVEDSDSKEKLVSASVSLKELNVTIVTNAQGDFSFKNICKGTYTLVVSHLHCETVLKTVVISNHFHIDIFMPHEKSLLSAVTVEGSKVIPNSGLKKELSGNALAETRGTSFSEALAKINGVTLLQTGSTISKPVIHGLHSNRILTINNGVRQEGQQWGNEHAPEIDPFIADKLAVVKGVDVLRYGSDAIGGVILVEPKVLRSLPGYSAEINAVYFTNNRKTVFSGVFEQQLKRFPALTYRIQATYNRAGNVATPDYRLNNTASEELSFSIASIYRKEKFSTEIFYSFFKTKLGIFTGSHIGNISDLENAIQAPKPDDVYLGQQTYSIGRPYQDVLHQLVKSKTIFKKGKSNINLLLSGQFNRRKEFDVVRSSANKKPQLDLNIVTVTEDLTWEQPRQKNISGAIGISGMQQQNSYAGRYFIPNYDAYKFGAFIIEKWKKQNWELQAGARYDYKTIATTRLKFNGDTFNYDFKFSTFASSLNVAYKPAQLHDFKINMSIALASRAPQVNELLSNGIHHGTATYEQGNINLKPEQSFDIGTVIDFQNDEHNLSFNINLYRNQINGFIYQRPVPDSPVLTNAGAFPKLEYTQTDALLKGLDLAIMFRPFHQLEIATKFSMLRARDRISNDWIIYMPADRFQHSLTYTFKSTKSFENSYVSIDLQQVMNQSRVPSNKNGKQDYKDPPPAYQLLAMYASAKIMLKKQPLILGVGVKNLLNVRYRDYLNQFRYFTDEMGRNISFKITLPIHK